jgi:hypothetical protein
MLAVCAALCALWSAPAAADPTHPRILTAGDIAACKERGFLERSGDFLGHIIGLMPEEPAAHLPRGARETARLLDEEAGLILPLGDLAYPEGTLDQFTRCYEPTWGRHRWRTRPVPGNHEYKTAGAAGYFAYWGDRAGDPDKGYYSYEYGQWFILAVNSEIEVDEGSEQLDWLRHELRSTDRRCIMAYFHRPRFASGHYGTDDRVEDLFLTLYEHGVSIVLNGHEHHYERMKPLNPDGEIEPDRGVRHFIVGTGGGNRRSARAGRRTDALDTDGWGILRLELRPESYAWSFLPARPLGFSDSGEASCVDRKGLGLLANDDTANDRAD